MLSNSLRNARFLFFSPNNCYFSWLHAELAQNTFTDPLDTLQAYQTGRSKGGVASNAKKMAMPIPKEKPSTMLLNFYVLHHITYPPSHQLERLHWCAQNCSPEHCPTRIPEYSSQRAMLIEPAPSDSCPFLFLSAKVALLAKSKLKVCEIYGCSDCTLHLQPQKLGIPSQKFC